MRVLATHISAEALGCDTMMWLGYGGCLEFAVEKRIVASLLEIRNPLSVTRHLAQQVIFIGAGMSAF
jgi:hypothetical protein